jgi:DNA invertase Pin-like site-specific DNA recombinase
MSDKIKPHHIERKAILYVRQSSTFQVQNNLESQKLQYAMRDRLCNLGWSDIEVIDEDLGRSASGTVTRVGFERMVAEVCLGQVGAVAAREVSRFARNSREWQKLADPVIFVICAETAPRSRPCTLAYTSITGRTL